MWYKATDGGLVNLNLYLAVKREECEASIDEDPLFKIEAHTEYATSVIHSTASKEERDKAWEKLKEMLCQ